MHPEPAIDGASIPRGTCVEELAQDGECLLYCAIRDEASALNRTATEIWQLCDGVQSIRAIAGVLAGRYAVDMDVMLEEVVRAVGAFHARGLIELGRVRTPETE
jgi:hypothetical protein